MPAKKATKKAVVKPEAEDPKTGEGEIGTGAETKMVEFEVTEQYLLDNPQYSTTVAAGDLIEVTEEEAAKYAKAPEKKEEAKSIKGATAILKNGREYVRTYAPDQKEEVKEFLSKDSAYSAVPDESVEALEVPYEVKVKETGEINRTSRIFTDKAEAVRFRNEHRSVCLVAMAKKK